MADPEYKTLHRAGIASDGWERFRAVLDEYIGAHVLTSDNPSPGQVLTIDDDGNATWADPASTGSFTERYVEAPATPDPWNDEFDDGDPDPANRGFVVLNFTGSVIPCTRVGPVDYTINSAVSMANNTYNSSLSNGKLIFQPGGANLMAILKPIPAGAGFYACRMTSSSIGGGSAYNQALVLLDNAGVALGLAGNNGISNEIVSTTTRIRTYQGATVTTELTAGNEADARAGGIWFIDWKNSGSTANVGQIDAHSGTQRISIWNGTLTGTFTPAYGGVILRFPNTWGPTWFEIDYFRRYPSLTFFPPT